MKHTVSTQNRITARGSLLFMTWWRHQMETFSASLALCAGNSPVPVNSSHKGQWRGALMFTLICVWINGWVNNHEAGDLRRYRVHYDVIVMRCVFLTFTWLVSAWLWREVPSAILAEPLLSDCVTVFCLRQCKSRHLKFVKFWNDTCYFQTNWISFILNWSVRFDVVSDAGRTCCCCSFLLLTVSPSDWRTSLKTKLEVSVRQQI